MRAVLEVTCVLRGVSHSVEGRISLCADERELLYTPTAVEGLVCVEGRISAQVEASCFTG